jgi:ATP-dependent helicase HrpA
LPDALREYLQQRLAQPLPADVWSDADLPLHLQMNIAVVDDAGQELASGRDLAALRAKLGDAAQLSLAAVDPAFERKGLRQWDFGDLPESLTFTRDGRRITAYPALVDEDNAVSLALLDTSGAAETATRAGVVRLLRIALRDAVARYDKGGAGFAQAALQLKAAIPTDRLLADVLAAALTRAFLSDDPLPRTEAAFAEQVKRARARLPAVMEGAFRLLTTIANEYQALAQRLATAGGGMARLAAEVRAQRDALVYPGFFAATPWAQLEHLPRYMKALDRRLAKFAERPDRDARHAEQVAELWRRYRERADRNRQAGQTEPPLEDFRWLLEELRVSLFAQELRTPFPVSFKRLERAWADLVR